MSEQPRTRRYYCPKCGAPVSQRVHERLKRQGELGCRRCWHQHRLRQHLVRAEQDGNALAVEIISHVLRSGARSQDAAARSMRIPPQTLHQLITGRRRIPDEPTIRALARAMRRSPDGIRSLARLAAQQKEALQAAVDRKVLPHEDVQDLLRHPSVSKLHELQGRISGRHARTADERRARSQAMNPDWRRRIGAGMRKTWRTQRKHMAAQARANLARVQITAELKARQVLRAYRLKHQGPITLEQLWSLAAKTARRQGKRGEAALQLMKSHVRTWTGMLGIGLRRRRGMPAEIARWFYVEQRRREHAPWKAITAEFGWTDDVYLQVWHSRLRPRLSALLEDLITIPTQATAH